MVLTVTKIVNDLERIGDEVKKIAYKAAQTRGSDKLARVRYFDSAKALLESGGCFYTPSLREATDRVLALVQSLSTGRAP